MVSEMTNVALPLIIEFMMSATRTPETNDHEKDHEFKDQCHDLDHEFYAFLPFLWVLCAFYAFQCILQRHVLKLIYFTFRHFNYMFYDNVFLGAITLCY